MKHIKVQDSPVIATSQPVVAPSLPYGAYLKYDTIDLTNGGTGLPVYGDIFLKDSNDPRYTTAPDGPIQVVKVPSDGMYEWFATVEPVAGAINGGFTTGDTIPIGALWGVWHLEVLPLQTAWNPGGVADIPAFYVGASNSMTDQNVPAVSTSGTFSAAQSDLVYVETRLAATQWARAWNPYGNIAIKTSILFMRIGDATPPPSGT